MRHSRKARDRGVLAEYVAGNGTQREGMQRRSNDSVFMKRGTSIQWRPVYHPCEEGVSIVERSLGISFLSNLGS
jgi:hypothetical protein